MRAVDPQGVVRHQVQYQVAGAIWSHYRVCVRGYPDFWARGANPVDRKESDSTHWSPVDPHPDA